MNGPYTYRYPLPFRLPSHLGYHSALGELPVLYSMFPSVIHFIHSINNVYVSIPVSQFLSPHPFPPWYPYICSLCLFLYFCFATKIIWIIFLDSRYMRYYTIFAFLFLTYFTLYEQSLGHSLGPFTSQQMIQFHSFLWLSNIPLYIHVPHLLYPFLCRWTLRLLPCPGYCK